MFLPLLSRSYKTFLLYRHVSSVVDLGQATRFLSALVSVLNLTLLVRIHHQLRNAPEWENNCGCSGRSDENIWTYEKCQENGKNSINRSFATCCQSDISAPGLRIKWKWHIVRIEEMRKVTSVARPERLKTGWRTIIKVILKKQVGKAWTGSYCLNTGPSDGILRTRQ